MRLDIKGQQSLVLPQALLDNLRMAHGAKLDAWLDQLPEMLEGLLCELDAHIVPGKPSLSYHLVFFAQQSNGENIAIKCTVPNHEQPPEVAAVHALSETDIGPQLIWSDLERGAMVMERVQPGTTLPTALPSLAEDSLVTQMIASKAASMARKIDITTLTGDLTSVHRYSKALGSVDVNSSLWRAHHEDIERAVALRDSLLREDNVFLHGDLHHYNIIEDEQRGWRVIDPKGLVGPAGYEFGPLTYNPVGIQHHPDLASIERQRIDIWSDTTGLSWETVRSWGYVAAVLSACWSAEGGGMHWQDAMTIALTLQDLAAVN